MKSSSTIKGKPSIHDASLSRVIPPSPESLLSLLKIGSSGVYFFGGELYKNDGKLINVSGFFHAEGKNHNLVSGLSIEPLLSSVEICRFQGTIRGKKFDATAGRFHPTDYSPSAYVSYSLKLEETVKTNHGAFQVWHGDFSKGTSIKGEAIYKVFRPS